MASRKKPSIWKLAGLDKKVTEILQTGILKQENGLRQLCDELNKTFADALGRKKFTPKGTLERLVWSKDRLAFLKHLVSRDMELTQAYQSLAYLPKAAIDQKAKKLRGHRVNNKSHEASAAGMGRILTSSEIISPEKAAKALPEVSLAKPYPVSVSDVDRFSILAVNGPSIGLLYSKVFNEVPLRCALREAELHGDDAVFVTGGLMFLDVKKSQGHLTTHRALLSGINFDPAVMDPDYRAMAEAVRSDLPPDKVGFVTLRERVLNLMHGFNKIATNEDGTPVFKGKVYITFGLAEEEIIEAAAHFEVLYIATVMRDEIVQERMAAEAALRLELRESDGEETEETERLKAEIKRLRKVEKRFIQYNVEHEDRKRFVASARAWLVRQFEANIPNSKVVAQGSAFLQAGTQRIQVYQDRNISASGGALDEYLKRKAGQGTLTNTLPELVLLANPLSINGRWAVRERMGKEGRTSTHVVQLPMALDKDFLQEQAQTQVRKVSQLENAFRHPQFEPGVTRLTYVNGIWENAPLTIGHIKHAFEVKRGPKGPRAEPEHLYFVIHTDDHTGHPWREEYYDPERDLWVGHMPAVMRLMTEYYGERKQLLPFHGYFLLDDPTQGHHFPTQSQPHQQVESFEVLQRRFRLIAEKAKAADTPAKALEQLRHLKAKALEQIRFRGVHWPELQVKEFVERVIEPNIDFFAQVIKRSQQAGVRILGPSELTGTDYDSRDAAVLSFGSGNHFGNTVENEMTEGFIYAMAVRMGLKYRKDFEGVDLDRLIRNPLFGNTPVGWGRVIGGKDGYSWGLSLRRDPARKSGANGDPLREAATNILERGDFTRIFGDNTVSIHLSGDIHRFGRISLTNAAVISCAPCTDTDPYGERGFSPNNVGNMIVGIPRKGPGHGPIRIIPINHDFVRHLLLKPRKINWDEIFVNPA